jgi:hypothetical protein
MSKPTCGTCRHFDGGAWGVCRRYPPVPTWNGKVGMIENALPIVDDDNVCGEHRSRGEDT